MREALAMSNNELCATEERLQAALSSHTAAAASLEEHARLVSSLRADLDAALQNQTSIEQERDEALRQASELHAQM